ncbi:MAG: PilZ domain-containing protein [Desulfobulbaceae bacterium]|nr:PilZ domain-containing protein [Desulfobulbaceae bacterium]
MTSDKRRAERIAIRLAVTVLLMDEKTDTVLAGPVNGEARNFSLMGIALSLDNVMIGNYHLFFACQDKPSHILKIGFKLSGDPKSAVEVSARPVWYDRDKESSGKKALFGIEFLVPPNDKVIKKLAKEFFAAGKAPSSWWEKIF